jgi:NAD(P)-dependent dehydrogenase (short-subunit alcohol dehydrogenase family)
MPSLQDRVAIVTGSSSGIGKGIAEYLSSLGARVIVHGLEREAGEALVAKLQASGREAVFVAGDLMDEAACRGIVRGAVERFGRLDVLVNNAAMTSRGDIETATVAFWDRIMAVNLRAPFILIQESVPAMRNVGGGAIVNIGSINAYIGQDNLGPYSVSKGGLMTLTRNAAASLARHRIRVNQLNVGWTLTEGEERVKREEEGRGSDWLEHAVKTRPFGRLLSPQDIAYATAYFATDASACITGTILDLEQFPIGAPGTW